MNRDQETEKDTKWECVCISVCVGWEKENEQRTTYECMSYTYTLYKVQPLGIPQKTINYEILLPFKMWRHHCQ